MVLDQTLLPADAVWLRCANAEDVADAIRRLAVRGAPAIGVAAAYGVVLGVRAGDVGSVVEAVHAALTSPPINSRQTVVLGRFRRASISSTSRST